MYALLPVLVLQGIVTHVNALPAAAPPQPLQNDHFKVHSDLSPAEAQEMVRRALRAELDSATDSTHPMQYVIQKTSPRLSTTKRIVETKDGDVARLIAVNGNPLNQADQQTENARLDALWNDPEQQKHRQQREAGDANRARKIIQALPDAFRYTYAGIAQTPLGPCYRMSFQPNPNFNPQEIEAQALKGMAGELWIDIDQQRVTRLEGKRLQDVDYGWGLIGKLEKDGTLLLEQADVGNHQWRTTHMVLAMNARILFKSVKLDTTLKLSEFTPVSAGIDYRKGIEILRAGSTSNAGQERIEQTSQRPSEASRIVPRTAAAIVE